MRTLVFALAAAQLEEFDCPVATPCGADEPARMSKVTVDYLAAQCLDGTPPVYFIRPGFGDGVSKYYVHHQGGGWCMSDADCLGRSRGALGSTKGDPDHMQNNGGYFSSDPAVNPLMYNWNMVYLRYCDGGSFTGGRPYPVTVENKTIYYRGRLVLDGMIDSLLTGGMSKATDVVISGCSAGGLATFLHVDHWKEALPNAKVRGMPDSGFFLDYEGRPHYHSGMNWVFTAMHSRAGVNRDCIDANPDAEWKCIFAEHTLPHIKTPMFILQSEYDSWQAPFDLGSRDTAMINTFGANLTKRLQFGLAANSGHATFLDSCYHHCGGVWQLFNVGTDTQATAFDKWYQQGSEKLENKGFFSQGKPFPCSDCCKKGPVPSETLVV